MEPYKQLCALVETRLIAALGRRPKGFVVAPCRVPGYHLYSNAGFFAGGDPALQEACPPQWTAKVQGGFINYRLSEAALRTAVETLAGWPVPGSCPAEQASRCSRLEALLALRDDEKRWGPEGAHLAWLLIRALPPVKEEQANRLWQAFERYFRCGQVDHQLVRALRLRLTQTK